MIEKESIVFLSGGTGTPKLLLGFRQLLSDEFLTIIGNTGDDDEFYGLLVSPDIDTLYYLFSERLDLEKFWGQKEDTFETLKVLEELGEETWFQLGDKDLSLHLLRNSLIVKKLSLIEISKKISRNLRIKAQIIPMSNEPVRTSFLTKDNTWLSFQEYTVKYREKIPIESVIYKGSSKAKATEEAIMAIENAKIIIIGPSNPITSIGPMLSIKGIKKALKKTNAQIIAISPLCKGKSFSGPAAKLMKELHLPPSSFGIAEFYKDFLDCMVICDADYDSKKLIEQLGIQVLMTDINLKTNNDRKRLAQFLLDQLDLLEHKKR